MLRPYGGTLPRRGGRSPSTSLRVNMLRPYKDFQVFPRRDTRGWMLEA